MGVNYINQYENLVILISGKKSYILKLVLSWKFEVEILSSNSRVNLKSFLSRVNLKK